MMNIVIKELDLSSPKQVEAMARWGCSSDLYPLITPVRDQSQASRLPTFEEEVLRIKTPTYPRRIYLLWDGERPIGNVSLQIDPGQLMKKIKGTAWLGLTVGEKEYWGKGVATQAMEFFEAEALRLGLKRAELGVFEFNQRAIHFYRKLGYQEFDRVKNFTFYQGRFWDDIRMEKSLK